MLHPRVIKLINDADAANCGGFFDLAVRCCHQVLAIAPDLPEAWYNLGLAFRGQGQTKEAIAALLKTAALSRNNPDAQKRFEAAESAARKALELDPESPEAWTKFGTALLGMNRYRKAEEAARAALQRAGGSVDAWTNLAAALSGRQPRTAGASPAAARRDRLTPSVRRAQLRQSHRDHLRGNVSQACERQCA